MALDRLSSGADRVYLLKPGELIILAGGHPVQNFDLRTLIDRSKGGELVRIFFKVGIPARYQFQVLVIKGKALLMKEDGSLDVSGHCPTHVLTINNVKGTLSFRPMIDPPSGVVEVVEGLPLAECVGLEGVFEKYQDREAGFATLRRPFQVAVATVLFTTAFCAGEFTGLFESCQGAKAEVKAAE